MSTEGHDDAPPQPQDTGSKGAPKVIKRYSNRKLYDTDRSKYVTLDEIAKMIKAGEELTIIDNETKEDLTSVTLTQIIYEEEKRESRMPLGMLRNLIQTGGASLQEFFDKSVKTPALGFRENVEKSVEKNIEDLVHSAAQIRDAATRSVTEFTDSARRMFSREDRRAEEFRRVTAGLLEELEARVTQRIDEVGEALAHAAQAEAEAKGEEAKHDLVGTQRSRLAVDAHVALLRAGLDAVRRQVDALEQAGRQAPVAPAAPPPEDPTDPA
jgi:polyhydroxyalkanoate synthesis repressor PhaR